VTDDRDPHARLEVLRDRDRERRLSRSAERGSADADRGPGRAKAPGRHRRDPSCFGQRAHRLDYTLWVQEAVRFFDAIAPRYDRVYARDARELRDRLDAAKLPKGRVLDLGIGTGRELAHLLDGGWDVTGIDFSPRMIEMCAKRARKVPIVHGDFYAPLPFADASFESAIALFGSLAHPPDPGAHARLAKELARVLVPGGILFAEMPAPSWDGRVHEDEASGVKIVIRAPTREEWRAVFEGWSLDITTSDDELILRSRSPARRTTASAS